MTTVLLRLDFINARQNRANWFDQTPRGYRAREGGRLFRGQNTFQGQSGGLRYHPGPGRAAELVARRIKSVKRLRTSPPRNIQWRQSGWYSVLSCDKLQRTFVLRLPDWQESLQQVMESI
jgi:hypothetical protein